MVEVLVPTNPRLARCDLISICFEVGNVEVTGVKFLLVSDTPEQPGTGISAWKSPWATSNVQCSVRFWIVHRFTS